MKHLLNDLKKLNLNERLEIIERTINSFSMEDNVVDLDVVLERQDLSGVLSEVANF